MCFWYISMKCFWLRGYLSVSIELTVKVTVSFLRTLEGELAFPLQCRSEKFAGEQIKNKPSFTCDLVCIMIKLQLLVLTTRWYFYLNWNVTFPLSASCSSPTLSTAVTSGRLKRGGWQRRDPRRKGQTCPYLHQYSTFEVDCPVRGTGEIKARSLETVWWVGRKMQNDTRRGGLPIYSLQYF